jgi:hypothetical protein
MKYLVLLLALTVIGITSFSQRLESPIDPNGLLYNITTIDHLRSIADSLQRRFHRSHPVRDYYSIQQGKGHYIRMSTGDIRAAMADIKRGIGYEEFIKKYRSAKTDSFILVTKEYIKDYYYHRTLVRYADELYKGSVGESCFDINVNDDTDGKWVCNSTGPTTYTNEEFRAFYFLEPPASAKLPEKYARLIFYTDYMIDTTTPIYYKDACTDDQIFIRPRPATGPALTSFHYTAKYYSGNAALAMIRNRRIGYMCNIGAELLGPIRDLNIARLAASTANWSVFLKTHLLFMGFEYRGKRITGIKELEDMDLHVPDLLLGSELKIANPSENHPFKYPRNVGRDLTDVSDKKALEQKILSMIRSKELDDLNRLLLHNMFLSYLSFLPEDQHRLTGLQQLEEADKLLPPYLYVKVRTDRVALPSSNMSV